MQDIFVLIAYGLLINAGFFMTFFWGRIAVRHGYSAPLKQLLGDRYTVISTCLTASSLGTSLYFMVRLYQALTAQDTGANSPYLSSYMLILALFIIAFSKAGFVWAIHCSSKSILWRSFIGLSVLWSLLAITWDLMA